MSPRESRHSAAGARAERARRTPGSWSGGVRCGTGARPTDDQVGRTAGRAARRAAERTADRTPGQLSACAGLFGTYVLIRAFDSSVTDCTNFTLAPIAPPRA